MDLNLQAAADLAQPNGPPLTAAQKQQWNDFIAYLDKTGYKGSPLLDNKNTALGNTLMEQYRKTNPDFSLTYDNISDVQRDLQDYRKTLVDQYKKNPSVAEGVKSEDEIMSGLSPVDGWLGSKTSNWRFPVGIIKKTTPQGTIVKNFGPDMAAYEAARQSF